MAWGHLEHTGLTSGCSRDSWGGTRGSRSPSGRPVLALQLPALIAKHLCSGYTFAGTYWTVPGRRAGTRMNQVYVNSPRPRFLPAFGVSVALPHACAAHAPESVVRPGLVISPYI